MPRILHLLPPESVFWYPHIGLKRCPIKYNKQRTTELVTASTKSEEVAGSKRIKANEAQESLVTAKTVPDRFLKVYGDMDLKRPL